jgi:hypothetical protein
MYITRTRAVLIFCSDGYCLSKNCMIELRATVTQGKPTIIPLVDPDASRGGLTEDQALHKALWANEPIENGTASARFKMCEYGKHPILSRP